MSTRPRPTGKARWLPLLLLVLVAALLTLLMGDAFYRALLLPLLELLAAAYALYRSLPELLLWGVLLLLVFTVAVRLLWPRVPPGTPEPAVDPAAGRVEVLAGLLAAGEGQSYQRWRLAHAVEAVLVEVLARQRGQTPGAVRQVLVRGQIEPPVALRPLFGITAELPTYAHFLEARQAADGSGLPHLEELDLGEAVTAAEAWFRRLQEEA